MLGGRGPVAQWIEQQPSKLRVAGSIPAGAATSQTRLSVCACETFSYRRTATAVAQRTRPICLVSDFLAWLSRVDRAKKGTFVKPITSREIDAPVPARLNAILIAAFLAVGLFQLFAVPALLAREGIWMALLLVPCVLSTTTNWSLIHEAIHHLLTPDRRLNDLYGRALAIFFGSPFALLRFPHLEHHRLNGTTTDRPEHFEIAKTPRPKAALKYYPNLLFGIYAAEMAGTLACLLPLPVLRRITQLFPEAHDYASRAEKYLLQPDRLRGIRLDAIAVISVYGLAFWCYGPYWPLLALSILGRGVLVSISDNSYHYGAALGAGPRSAYNLRLPGGAGILHFNLHRVHHLHPTLPWIGLPKAFEADSEGYDIGYAAAMLRQFRGPIPDTEYAQSS